MKCPFCLDIEMKLRPEWGGGWEQCPNCSATEIENPTVPRGSGEMTISNLGKDIPGSYKPLPSGVTRANKARRDRVKAKGGKNGEW